MFRSAVVLHNFLHRRNNAGYIPGGFVDSYQSIRKYCHGHGLCLMVEDLVFFRICQMLEDPARLKQPEVSKTVKSYVNSMEGSLPWQWNHARSRGNILKT